MTVSSTEITLINHQRELSSCTKCSQMIGPVIFGNPVDSRVMSIGQAPGVREGDFGKPFAWTAGKTLFKWFARAGISEEDYRNRVYMSAVCRCFPGKNPKGGDRVPDREEIEHCSAWLNAELDVLQPELIIPIGKLAIAQYLDFKKLSEVIGQSHRLCIRGFETDLIPLPHPSGLNTWVHTEPGKGLLNRALELIEDHPAWQAICTSPSPE